MAAGADSAIVRMSPTVAAIRVGVVRVGMGEAHPVLSGNG
jgi:hypothetical protein